MLDLILGYDCNCKCDYCTISEELRPRALSTQAAQRALEAGRSRGHRSVQFGGGEPTIRADLLKLVRAARRLGYEDVKVQSNGLRYAHGPYVDALVRAGVSTFAISIMSHRAGLYEKITGFPRARALVLEGLGHIRRHSVRLVADVIMKRDTYTGLPDLVPFYAERQVREFVLWLVSLTDRNAQNPQSLVPVSEMRPFIERACAAGAAAGVAVRSRHVPRCLLPGLAPEHFVDTRAEDVRVVTPEGSFDLRDSRVSANRFVAACERCSWRPSCAGIRADYLEQVGDGEIIPLPAAGVSPARPMS